MKKIKAGIIGATGYAGAELLRILRMHPMVEIAGLSSVSFEGQRMDTVYPAFSQIEERTLEGEDAVIAASEIVFAALPHGLSEPIAAKCLAASKKMIDLGADFRLKDAEVYEEWYGLQYAQPELHEKAVYSIPELHRKEAASAEIIGNPGCYPTSVALALAPAIKSGMIDLDSIIIDAKSGTSGAGRGLSLGTHFAECNETIAPYKIAEHRHTAEIEQTLSGIARKPLKVLFVPHLVPMNRGILSTVYARLNTGFSLAEIMDTYQKAYNREVFVRILPEGQVASPKYVKYSNYCDISLHIDARTNRLVIVSAIDNMVKGAGGQAVQNMNLLCGLPEDTGLKMIPPSF